jgi:hypothetical protein
MSSVASARLGKSSLKRSVSMRLLAALVVAQRDRFAWWGRREFPFRMPSPEAELTELFEVFSSINEAWEGRDKRAVSTMLINTVDTVSKRVFTWGSSSRNHAPNDCHSLANRSFSGSRSTRWRCWGQRAAGRPRFPWLGQWSRVDNRRAVGTLRGLTILRSCLEILLSEVTGQGEVS